MNPQAMIRKVHIALDVSNLEIEATFWGAVLGQEPGPIRSGGGWLTVGELPGGGWLILQKVPELKRDKLRMHLDLIVGDVDEAIARIVELGGKQISDPRRGGGVTMADPEGNEFCIGAFERSKKGVRTPVEKAQ